MDFTGVNGEINAFENVPPAGSGDTDVKIVDFKKSH
jgi:hypothetical protein